MSAIMEARGLGFRYRRGHEALHDVSFAIDEGAGLGIVGESGAGKSTLLRILLGLTRPTTGELLVEGLPLDPGRRSRMREYRRFTQMVFQDPYSSLDPRQSIGRIVAEPLRSLGIARDRAEIARRVEAALRAVGLPPDTAGRYPHEFSGGQRQRIAIARALVPQPRVLLADEPVSALDVTTRIAIIDLIAQLRATAETPLTLVLVSHDLGVVATLCDRLLVLERGNVVEQGASGDVLREPRHPYTRRLLASVPRLPR